MTALLDPDFCYRVARSRDSRFDGQFVLAVTSTGIYCRPSCPAMTPKRSNVRFYRTPATAQAEGFRACLRCLPDAAPGSPDWDLRADLVGRAMRLVSDGVVERDGVSGLAQRLGYSARHLNRQLIAELGVGPLALARARRAQIARTLIETTALPFAEVAFAAGFSSIRQFNDTVREVFASTPSELRVKRGSKAVGGPGVISLRLAYREPFDAAALWGFLGARAVPGVERIDGDTYQRTLRLPHGVGAVALTPAAGYVRAELTLADLRDLGTAVHRCRRLLDLDADPVAVDSALATDPVLEGLVAAHPGLRVPGAVDGTELAVRAVLGQQVSVAAARTVAGRLAEAYGDPVEPEGARVFPSAGVLAELTPADLPMPASRARSLLALCATLASGDLVLDSGTDPADALAVLQEIPGIGPWTAGYIALRATGAPDVFLPGDLGVRRAAARLGLPGTPHALDDYASRWRPWRSYAVLHLWQSEHQ
ncbi:DNA-3-methyladenine glycosylase 2 family protein [Cryptosporangium arvum]|uniref:DNA-3-methyladenine glycosylase 2 family protein n=1 Tax=Cryptosporangium arvum TaxID=80871 RepID=UPI0004BA2D1E|nr:DNA-3-methyladenine glycosylase 2 [Cryptosporangium arvum]